MSRWFATLVLALGCNGAGAVQDQRCETLCEGAGAAQCSENDVDWCRSECEAAVAGLSDDCALCVLEESDAMQAECDTGDSGEVECTCETDFADSNDEDCLDVCG